ncbi:RND family efflux transporter, MFP subunit [Pseudidiomarina planktonica]|uniref:RND family efflux transporter, MFP subunit n=1 Tax=Pseudidiomarina planktonica TaxID=1323738 RepID=A0A1Y6ESE2_9GAMM|nr:efflux RND transporter periplasmic adaptor subunit [Pseudidiomarina planktonica]SMQ65635.1 RND family efflux transporter, MFP subunit [Pseudidiomarina planktonica]
MPNLLRHSKLTTQLDLLCPAPVVRALVSGFCLALILGIPLAPAYAQDPVTVAEVKRTAIVEVIRTSGTLVSLRNAQVSVRTAGLIESTAAEAGDMVTDGQSLLRLDAELIQSEVAVAEAEQQQAEALATDAQQQFEELATLEQQQSVATSEVRRARAELAAAKANATAAAANAERSRVILSQHQLKSPFAGIIGERYVTAGEWVNPGDIAYQLVDPKQVYADFYLPQASARFIKKDLPVQLLLNKDRSYKGRVAELVPVANQPSRTFRVRVKPNDALLQDTIIGAAVEGEFRFELAEQGLVVPRDALVRYPDGRTAVWIAQQNDDNQWGVSQQQVTIGRTFDGLVEIVDGLSADARVVVRGNESLQQDQQVELVEASSNGDR